MHLDYSHESPEHLIVLLRRRRTTALIGVIVGLISALAIGIAMVTLMYR